jgi:hypothetical protein
MAYAGTGTNSGEFLDDFWGYDKDANTWTQINSLVTDDPMHGATAAVLNDKAYLIGGRKSGGVYSEIIFEFDPASSLSWTMKKVVPGLTLEEGASFTLNKKVFFGYGANGGHLRTYDPVTNTISDFGSLPDLESVDRGPIAFAIDSTKAYFGLGYSSVVANQANAYRNEMWKLEVEITSAVGPLPVTLQAIIAPLAAGTYQVLAADDDTYTINVYTLNGSPIVSDRKIRTHEPFDVVAPTGLYLFCLHSAAGNMKSELIFNGE